MSHPRYLVLSLATLAAFCIPPALGAESADLVQQAVINGDIHRVPRASSPIGVDGLVEEGAWEGALKLELPFQVWPGDNAPTEVRTEALLMYDSSHVYAAFRAHDPDPSAIRARLSDRDRAFQDDFVGIVVDTFNDERRAFEFFVNAMGVQMDLVMDDVNGNEDSSWDAIWDSAGRLTSEGYEVEMAIPFTSLRFQRVDGDQVWGLDLVRKYPRDQGYLLASNPRDRDRSCYLCQVGKVVGFNGATPGKNLEITPTFTAVRTDTNDALVNKDLSQVSPRKLEDVQERGLERGDADYDAGLTVKWGMTPNLTLSGTVNPDFSQVEADAARLDVNEQFALFFPEKRPFFLEGQDFFDTPLQVVHTRMVADPLWGAKLTGKEGSHALGAFVAQDEITNLIFPGSHGSDGDSFDEQTTDGVFRYRRDIGQNSAVGGIMTARTGKDYHNVVLGADALLRPADSDTIRVQLLTSQTEDPEQVAFDNEQPGGGFRDTALHVGYSHWTKYWGTWARYRDLGPDFRSDLGFIPQVNIRQPVVGYERRWWGEPESWWSRMNVGADWDQTVDHDGNLIERETEVWYSLSGPKRSHVHVAGGHRQSGFREDVFDQGFAHLCFNFWPVGDVWVSLSNDVAKRIDYAFEDPDDSDRARQGDEYRVGPSIRWNIGRRVRLDLSHTLRQLSMDEGKLFEANLTELRLAFQWNVRSFFRAIVQYADVERDIDLYPACVQDPDDCGLEPEYRDLFTQLLFSYKINPQTALFVGYTESQFDLEELDSLTRADRTLFFKVGYAWVN
jgi:hypothetical protein